MTLKLNGSTAGSVSIDAPADTSPTGTDVTLTLPTSAGSSGQYLQTNGSGTLSWQTVEGLPDAIDVNASAPADSVNLDASGRLLVGETSSTQAGSIDAKTQIVSTDFNAALTIRRNQTGDGAPGMLFCKSRGTSNSANVVVSNGDGLGNIRFFGADSTGGNDFAEGGAISCVVDGTPGSNDMPSRLEFKTTADGASSPTERMRIDRNGAFNCYHNTYGAQFRTNAAAGTTYELMYLTYGATNVTNGTNCLRVYTNGNVQNTNNSYGGFSDIKLKENIVDASSQWDDIKALQIRKYNFKEETGLPTHTQLGIVAQEVELISPGLVTESPERGDVQIPVLDEDGNAVLDENGDQVFNTEIRDLGTTIKSVNYSVLYMKAVKALQEAMERIETLETANASQAATIAALDARLTALEGGAS
jgi:hypothetical protein